MRSNSIPPECPDFTLEYANDGFDLHIHLTPDGVATIVSSIPSRCSDPSAHDWWAAMRNRGFVAFAVKPAGNEEEYED